MDSISWTRQDSFSFIENGNIFVPNRARQYNIISCMIPDKDNLQIVDLCCGEAILEKYILDKHPNSQISAYDGSKEMIEKAKLNHYGDTRVKFYHFDIFEKNWRQFSHKVDVIVSSLAIHHLDEEQKQSFFKDMYTQLNPGGVLIIADIVQPISKEAINIAAFDWDASAYEQSIQFVGDLSAYQSFIQSNWNSFTDPEPDEVDKPSPIYRQLRWLENAGYTDIDVYWMKAGHAIFGGKK